MLRAFLARVGLSVDQLELGLGGAPERVPPPKDGIPPRPPARDAERPRTVARDGDGEANADPDALLARLRTFGLRGIDALRLTRNRTTMVSFRGATLRLHEAFATAPEEVQRAIAVFVSGRGAARTAARRVILGYKIDRPAAPPVRRPSVMHPDDLPMAARLTREHARLNAQHFGGALRALDVKVSRRMKTRLGHFAPGRGGLPEIAISRRHIRRHGWEEAIATLLHEMVHQWQDESGHPLDHGPVFRRKAHEVGVVPRAKRHLR